MKLLLAKGSTSNILQIFIRDSSSTIGAGLTGLLFNTSSLVAYYHRDSDTTATAITLVTMTVGTFTSSGFKEIDSTNMPGWYQFCPPNAAIASGANNVSFHLKGATNMASLPIEMQLVSFDPYSASNLGLTNLDATISSRLAPAGTLATVTALTNAPTSGDFTATMKTSLNAATPSVTVSNKTGFALTTAEHTLITADVNSALNGTEIELASVPGVTSSLRLKLSAIFQYLLLKRTTTVTTETMYKNDSSTSLGTSTVSDDGTTATHGKVS